MKTYILFCQPYLYENGRNGENKGSDPDKGQYKLGLLDCANGLGLHWVDDGVAAAGIKKIRLFQLLT